MRGARASTDVNAFIGRLGVPMSLSTVSCCRRGPRRKLNCIVYRLSRGDSAERRTVAGMPATALVVSNRRFRFTAESSATVSFSSLDRALPRVYSFLRVWSRQEWTSSRCCEFESCRSGTRDAPADPMVRMTGAKNAFGPWNRPAPPRTGRRPQGHPVGVRGGLPRNPAGPGKSGESAEATPCPLAIAAPMPSATANPPTRPTYVPQLVIHDPLVSIWQIIDMTGESCPLFAIPCGAQWPNATRGRQFAGKFTQRATQLTMDVWPLRDPQLADI